MNSLLSSTTAKFYAFAFLSECILIYPLYTLLFADKGLSPAQISSLLIVWSATTFLLEVPSGALADRFDRKRLLVVAMVLRLAGFASWLAFQNYAGFLAGFVLWGAGSAFESGTLEALLYDELSRLKQTNLYAKITGRMESLNLIGVLVASVLAGVLASRGYSWLLVGSLVAIALAMTFLLLLPGARRVEDTGEADYWSYLKDGVREALFKPAILLIVLFAALTAGLASNDEYQNLLFREKGLSNSAVAIWLGVVGLFGVAGSLLAHRLEKRKLPLELLLIVWAGLLFAAAVTHGVFTPLFICAFTLMFFLIKVLFGTYLQHAVSDATRATTTSVVGLVSELFALVTYAILGMAAQHGSYMRGFQIIAAAIVVAAVFLWIFARFVSRKFKVEKLGL